MDFRPISIQAREVWIYQVPESGTVVLVDQRHEERHAHQGVMGGAPRLVREKL
jgi:hypothetical protein